MRTIVAGVVSDLSVLVAGIYVYVYQLKWQWRLQHFLAVYGCRAGWLHRCRGKSNLSAVDNEIFILTRWARTEILFGLQKPSTMC